ncbi:3-hydroxyisobutyrate dehydrogenase [Gryllotalpicola daejeonensis]|uniref:3-hydroxyisobutyrate dehydrogenase n=1 Tax=Gryllotalpicola daejeonensis TaxID=993087 RepID=A0ABP7ZHG1_9MICO
MEIAFIGLGHMGAPMAANLVKAGHRVVGFDLAPAANEAALAAGVEIAESGAAAARSADVVITMLQQGRQVIAAYEGGDGASGLLESARPGALFIDSSTISVADARVAHELAARAGFHALDAPVSGGVVGAEAGTLAFMVGGSAEDFAAAEPVFGAMGARIVHCGGPGLGQAAKICNNLMLGISMIGVSEAFVLGERLGLTDQALYDVASNASGQCWSLTTNCPVPGPVPSSPANHGYRPGFAAALMAKDLGLAEDAIGDTGAHAELGRLAAEIFRRFSTEGGAESDFSAIIEDIRARSETKATA